MADLTEFAKNWSVLGLSDQNVLHFLKDIIIGSFNNYNIEKWADGKAFYVMASAQFFAT